jgi:hypothetical protein
MPRFPRLARGALVLSMSFAALGRAAGGPESRVAAGPETGIATVRLYRRALRTSEAIGTFRAVRAEIFP